VSYPRSARCAKATSEIVEDVVIAAWAKPGTTTPSDVFGVALE
jgi:hypothetical protein